MKILAIETSCDETAISKIIATGTITNPKFKVVANAISSQINIHRPFGGVVPNLAKREHEINLPILLKRLDVKGSYSAKATKDKQKSKLNFLAKDCDMIAVTVGPGLEPALWAGITFAKNLAKEYKKPLIGVNHLEGHLYSFLLKQKTNLKFEILNLKFPTIALLVSGGHTILLKLDSLTKWKKLGETVDDAVGEAFDKVARLLELPYPGGPEIEKLALRQASLDRTRDKQGKHPEGTIEFPRPMLHQKNYNFSFSGLKTSVLYYLRSQTTNASESTKRNSGHSDKFVISDRIRADVAASFQKAAVETLVRKTLRAIEEFGAKSLILAGGVAANKFLRAELKRESSKIGVTFFSPESEYNTDNATMIAVAGYMSYLRKKKLPLKANGNLGI